MTYPIRILDFASLEEAANELKKIGVEPAGVEIMKYKTSGRILKIHALPPPAANILKQEMLSLGGEAATPYGAINCSVKSCDVLLMGTLKQLQQLSIKLSSHPFGLPQLAGQIERVMNNYAAAPAPLVIGTRTFEFGPRTFLMGILNVTPDSFSDGGKFFSPKAALAQARRLKDEGADLLDIGGESTRPGADKVPAEEEIQRVVPVIKMIKPELDLPLSIDTRKAQVAQAALLAGADMVNDISGLRYDPQMASVIAKFKVPVCLMHCQGDPKVMQENPIYYEVISDILLALQESIEIAKNAGILWEKIIIDPGLGFGKTVEHNLEIIRKLKEFKVLGRPILLGPSRKSFIGKILDQPPENRLWGSAGTAAVAICAGADIMRIHDVKQIKEVVKITDAILRRQGKNG